MCCLRGQYLQRPSSKTWIPMWQYRSMKPGSLYTHHHRLSCDLTARLPRRSSAAGLSASLAPLKASVGKFLGGFASNAASYCADVCNAFSAEC